jgi:hypothetical protein
VEKRRDTVSPPRSRRCQTEQQPAEAAT